MGEVTGALSHVVVSLLVPGLALLMGLYALHKGWRSLRATNAMPLDWYDRWWLTQTRLLHGTDAADRLRARLANIAAVHMLGYRWLFAGCLQILLGLCLALAELTR